MTAVSVVGSVMLLGVVILAFVMGRRRKKKAPVEGEHTRFILALRVPLT